MIKTIGDSHSDGKWSNWDSVPGVETNWLKGQGKLAYSIGRDGIDITNFDIKEGDTVIFCFGEIDCRCHVHKHVNKDKSYKNVIDEIVFSYINAIKKNINIIPNTKFCVYNVVPPVRKAKVHQNPEYPHLGSDNDRKNYHEYFNKKLKEYCIENDFIFFDVYKEYSDDEGFLKKEMSDNNVHLRDPKPRVEFIKKYLK